MRQTSALSVRCSRRGNEPEIAGNSAGKVNLGNEGADMSTTDKAKNAAEKAKGKAKEAAGRATGNESLKAKGKAEQVKGGVKQAGENVKDAAKDAAKKD